LTAENILLQANVSAGMMGKASEARWEHFPHQADIGIRGFGVSKEQAFEQAAVALTAVITSPDKVEPEKKVEIECGDLDDELLLVDWLNCLLYEMATRKMLFNRFEVRIGRDGLRAAAWGQKIDVSKHRPVVEVKAATYTELSVRQDEQGAWVAQCVVDV
jgi:SHS2 domain-containing protein